MLAAIFPASCGDMGPGRPPSTETGVVIAADGPDAANVDRFTLRTEDGEVLPFRVGKLDVNNGGLPAPHLREHLVSGEPITVYYYGDGESRYITRYVDAPPVGAPT